MRASAWPPGRIPPSLLANRGFTSGLLLGLAFFAAVSGLAYVLSLFFQTALGLKPDAAALALGPLMAGIIIASVAGRPLVGKLGRRLVIIGLGLTLACAAGLWGHDRGRGDGGQRLGAGALDPRARGGHGSLLQQHLRRRDRGRRPG